MDTPVYQHRQPEFVGSGISQFKPAGKIDPIDERVAELRVKIQKG